MKPQFVRKPEFVRAFIRYPSDVPVEVEPCEAVNGRAHPSVSGIGSARPTPGGICFPFEQRLEAGALVHVTVRAPRGAEEFTVKVAWTLREGLRYLTGARLLDEHDACRARLVAQLCLIDAYRRTEQAGGRELDEDTAAREWIARHAHEVPVIG